jgi:hypothetical protein
VCLSLVGVAGQPEPPKNPDPATVAVASTANDDAAKHAKRTACLKEAKAKKLIGAERSAYLKDCIAAPAAAGT